MIAESRDVFKGKQRNDQNPKRLLAYVPISLRTGDVLAGLSPRFWCQGQSVDYLVDRIHWGMANNGGKPTPISSKFNQQNLGMRNAKPLVDACCDHGVIVPDGQFYFATKCTSYALGDQFKTDDYRYKLLTDKALLRRLAKVRAKREEERKKTWWPWHYRWETWQKSLGIDRQMALDILHSLPAGKDHFGMQERLIDDLWGGMYRLKKDAAGRLYGNATNLKAEVRKALRLAGEPIEGLDISNSQPVFLGILLDDHKVLRRRAYQDAVADDLLYVTLARMLGIGRKSAKILFFRDILGKKGEYPSEMENVFGSLYPQVLRFIRSFNRHDHGALLRELTRQEAELVIHRVGMALPKDVPFFSIHDGVYCPEGYTDTIRIAFRQATIGHPIPLKAA